MSTVLLKRWVADGSGLLYRRGITRGVPPPPPGIISQDFESFSTMSTLGTNPAGVNAFRQIVGDPDYGYVQAQHDHMAIVDLGGSEGKTLKVRYDDDFHNFVPNNGVAYAPELSKQVEGVKMKYRLRFDSGFITGKGGKIGVGIGGYVSASSPVSPHTTLTDPPSGGNSTPYGWSCRSEWGADGKLHELVYLPLRAKYDGSVVYGIGRTLTGSAWVKGQFYNFERHIILNTATQTNPNIDPRTLVQGTVTSGLPNGDGDYYANGIHRVFLDGVQVYEKTDEVFRLYAGAWAKDIMWSWFRGGGDSTWSVTGGPCYASMSSYSIEELT